LVFFEFCSDFPYKGILGSFLSCSRPFNPAASGGLLRLTIVLVLV
jgi:hypothetical protein